MTDRDTLHDIVDANNAAHTLNEISQPLRHAVTFAAGGELGTVRTWQARICPDGLNST